MKNKIIYLIVGESASGKDSVANQLELDGYKVLKSYATRPKRLNEKNTHVFINPNQVEQYKNDMVAYTKIGDYEYFSTKNQLLENDIYIIDPNGVEFMQDKAKEKVPNIKFVTIYINVKEQDRKVRALQRNDSIDVMNKRFDNEKQQFENFKKNANFNYSVENYNVQKTIDVVKQIIRIEEQYNE